jgi:hypothetical protein
MLSIPTGRGVMMLDTPKLPSFVFRLYGPRDPRVDEEILDPGAIGERQIRRLGIGYRLQVGLVFSGLGNTFIRNIPDEIKNLSRDSH